MGVSRQGYPLLAHFCNIIGSFSMCATDKKSLLFKISSFFINFSKKSAKSAKSHFLQKRLFLKFRGVKNTYILPQIASPRRGLAGGGSTPYSTTCIFDPPKMGTIFGPKSWVSFWTTFFGKKVQKRKESSLYSNFRGSGRLSKNMAIFGPIFGTTPKSQKKWFFKNQKYIFHFWGQFFAFFHFLLKNSDFFQIVVSLKCFGTFLDKKWSKRVIFGGQKWPLFSVFSKLKSCFSYP